MEKDIFAMMGKNPDEKKGKGPTQQALPVKGKDVERDLLLERMKQMKATLEIELDNIQTKGKELKQAGGMFVQDKSELNQEELARLKAREEALRAQVGATATSKKSGAPIGGKQTTTDQERKNKLRGAKNKWIPVR